MANGGQMPSYCRLIARLTWPCLVGSTFLISAYLICQSYNQWQDDPLEVTIDSLTESIFDIQFPTVTVCPDSKTPIDNWSPVEAVANLIKTGCGKDFVADEWVPCTDLTIRQDLGFIYDNVASALMNNINLKYSELEIPPTSDSYVNAYLQMYNLSSSKEIKDLFLKSLGLFYTPSAFKASTDIGKHMVDNFRDVCPVGDNGSSCITAIMQSELTLLMTNLMVGYDAYLGELGTFLSKFAPNITSSLSKNELLWTCHNASNCQEGNATALIMRKSGGDPSYVLDPAALKLQSFFSSLTEAFNFSAPNPISLFEVPIMLSPLAGPLLDAIRVSLVSPFNLDTDCIYNWKAFINKGVADVNTRPNCSYNVRDFLGSNLTSIFRVMKLVTHGGKSYTTDTPAVKEDFLPTYEKRNIIYHNGRENVDLLSMIPYCEFTQQWGKSSEYLDCNMFSPVASDAGICYSFNAKNFTDLYRNDSYFAQSFSDAFHNDFNRTNETHRSPGLGDRSGLIFYLDRQWTLRPDKGQDQKNSFIISFNNDLNPFRVLIGNTQVKIGYRTSIYLTPSQLVSDSQIRKFAPETRNCRFSDEIGDTGMRIFNVYTQAGCQFECMLNYSRTACGCTPWNYPFPDKEYSICDLHGAWCFAEFMQRMDQRSKCRCLPDCDKVEFKLSRKEETLLDSDDHCLKNLDGDFYSYYLRPKIYARMNNLEHISSLFRVSRVLGSGRLDYDGGYVQRVVDQLCREVVQNEFAVVTVQLDTETYTRIRRSPKMTMEAQVGLIGGTLGLFTGISVLSIAADLWEVMKKVMSKFLYTK